MMGSLLLALLLAVQQNPAPVQNDSVLEARTREVASILRCPVCQGLSIQDSPAELAQNMRAVVKEQLRAGRTPEEVKGYFVAKYGEWILLQPKARGFNLTVYLLPVVMLLGGAVMIVLLVRKWSRNTTIPAAPAEEEVERETPVRTAR